MSRAAIAERHRLDRSCASRTYDGDAEIIAVGSELLTSQRVDTNSLFITDQLNALGVEVRRKLIVGDDRDLPRRSRPRRAVACARSSSSPAAWAPPKTI